jgi:hypothetical protein
MPTLWSVVLPNIRPALATLFILFALDYWNNLLWPPDRLRQVEKCRPSGWRNDQPVQGVRRLLLAARLWRPCRSSLFIRFRKQFMAGTAVTERVPVAPTRPVGARYARVELP